MQVTDPVRYNQIARIFHWASVLLITAVFGCGITMGQIGRGPVQDSLFFLHLGLGVTVLGITVLRLIWRMAHPVPAEPAFLGTIQIVAARTTHWLLYALLIAQPVIGWIGESAFGRAFER